jgi:hypothetical protein
MSPQVMNLSHSARLMFIGLITQADDEGRGSADVRYLKSAIFPGDHHTSTTKLLRSVADQCLVDLYAGSDGEPLYAIRNWKRHQKIDKPKKSSFPSPKGSDASLLIEEESPTSRHGSDLIGSDLIKDQGSDRIKSARARVSEDPSRAQKGNVDLPKRDLAAEVRQLARVGNQAGDILKLLSRFHLTEEQVTAWLAEAAPA